MGWTVLTPGSVGAGGLQCPGHPTLRRTPTDASGTAVLRHCKQYCSKTKSLVRGVFTRVSRATPRIPRSSPPGRGLQPASAGMCRLVTSELRVDDLGHLSPGAENVAGSVPAQ